MTGDEAHNAFGQVGVEVVADDAPAHFRRDRAEEAVEEGGEIVLCAAVADRAQDRSGGHIEGGDQGLCAVSPVFEFVSFHLARSHGQVGGHPLKRLMPVISSIDTVRTVRASRSDRKPHRHGAFGLEILRFGRQPRARQMGLEVGSFLKSAPHGGAKDDPRDPVSPPRRQDRSHSSGSAEDRSPWVACRPGQ